MYAFIIPSKIKKAALTELPMIPPIVLKLSNREETAAAVAATTIDVMITIVECPSEKKVPTVTGF
jgi:hypothetical protein